jgi:uncharacterized delta-60 repeat protein
VVVYQRASFGVIASGTAPLSFQWQTNGAPIPGATNDQLVISQARFADAGLYSVVVSNVEGHVTSADAGLTVKAPVGGDLDGSFAYGGLFPYGLNIGGLNAIVQQPNGRVLVAGGVRGGIARLNGDGTTDYTFTSEVEPNGDISSVALQSAGKVLIAGAFTSVNGVSRTNLARLNPDGTLDSAFQNVPFEVGGIPASAYWVAVQNNGQILIGGQNAGGWWGIARVNPDGTLDGTYLNGVSRVDGSVRALALQSDGSLLLGGFFLDVAGSPASGIARLNPDGSLDYGFAPTVNSGTSSGGVEALAVQSDGGVLIGGRFDTVNGEPRNEIARLNADGSLDYGFQNGLSGLAWDTYYEQVSAIVVQSDGKVLVAGSFTNVNDVSRNMIARLNPNGSLDESFQNPMLGRVHYNPPYISSMALQSDGKVIIGGTFTTVDGRAHNYLSRLNGDGSLDGGFQNPTAGANSDVVSVAIQGDGRVLLAGDFTTFNDEVRNYVARLNPDATLDPTFQNVVLTVEAGVDYGASIYSMAVQGDGKVLVAGYFTSINGTGRTNLARLNADGTLDTLFVSTGPGYGVNSLAVQTDGKVLVGGYFSAINGVGRTNLARLDSDGTLDSSFQSTVDGAYSGVNAIALQGDGKVLIGGSFTSVDGISRQGIARLNPDGVTDTGFQNGLSGVNGTVNAVVLQDDGRVLIGGGFTTVNGFIRHNIARLNSDGTLDGSFQNGLAGVTAGWPNHFVSSVVVQADGKVVVVGWFDAVNGVGRNNIARLNADGTLDTSFLSGSAGPDNQVNSVAVQSDGQLLVGGNFTTINGLPAAGIARLWAGPAYAPNIERITGPAAGAVALPLRLQASTTNRVQFKTNLADAAWTDLPGDLAIGAFNYVTNALDPSAGGAKTRFYRVHQLP